jgi:hypothetical protein
MINILSLRDENGYSLINVLKFWFIMINQSTDNLPREIQTLNERYKN